MSNVNLENFGSSILANAMRYMEHTPSHDPNSNLGNANNDRRDATATSSSFPPAQGSLDTAREQTDADTSEIEAGTAEHVIQPSQSRAESIVSSFDYNYLRECAALGLSDAGDVGEELQNSQRQLVQQEQTREVDRSRLFQFRPFDEDEGGGGSAMTPSSSSRNLADADSEIRDGESEIVIGEATVDEEVRLPRSTTQYLQEFWDRASHDSRITTSNVTGRRSLPRVSSIDTRRSQLSASSRPSSSFSARQRVPTQNHSVNDVIDLTLSPPAEDALLRTRAWMRQGTEDDDDSASLEDAVGLIRFDWEGSRDEQGGLGQSRLAGASNANIPRPSSSLSSLSLSQNSDLSTYASSAVAGPSAVDWSLNQISEREEERLRNIRQDPVVAEEISPSTRGNASAEGDFVAVDMLPSARAYRLSAPRSTLSSVRRWERSIQRIRDDASTGEHPRSATGRDVDILPVTSPLTSAGQLDSLTTDSRRIRRNNVQPIENLEPASRQSALLQRSNTSSPFTWPSHSMLDHTSSRDSLSMARAPDGPTTSAFSSARSSEQLASTRPFLRARLPRSSSQEQMSPDLSSGLRADGEGTTLDRSISHSRPSLLPQHITRSNIVSQSDEALLTESSRATALNRRNSAWSQRTSRPIERSLHADNDLQGQTSISSPSLVTDISEWRQQARALTAWRASDRAAASREEERRIMTTYREMDFPDPEATLPYFPGRPPLRPLVTGATGQGIMEADDMTTPVDRNNGMESDAIPRLPSLRSRSPLTLTFAEAEAAHRQQHLNDLQRHGSSVPFRSRRAAVASPSDANPAAVATISQRPPTLRPLFLSAQPGGDSSTSSVPARRASAAPSSPSSAYLRRSLQLGGRESQGERTSSWQRQVAAERNSETSNHNDELISEMENVRRRILAVADAVSGLEGLVGSRPHPARPTIASGNTQPSPSAGNSSTIAGRPTRIGMALDAESRAFASRNLSTSRSGQDAPSAVNAHLSRLRRMREQREREGRQNRALSLASNDSPSASSSVSASATAGADADGSSTPDDGPPRLQFHRPRDIFSDIFLRATGSSRYGNAAANNSIQDDPGNYLTDEQFEMRNSYEHLLRLSMQLGEARPKGAPADVVAKFPTCQYRVWQGGSCADPFTFKAWEGETDGVPGAFSGSHAVQMTSVDRKGKRRAVDPLDALSKDNLPLHVVSRFAERETRCAVCLETYDGMDMLMSLPCEHSFHETCIKVRCVLLCTLSFYIPLQKV